MTCIPRVRVVRIEGGAAERLDRALSRHLPEEDGLSRSRIQQLIRAGAVSTGGQQVREPDAPARPDEVWAIELEGIPESELLAEDIPIAVLHEDDDVLVIDKQAGLVVHPGPGTPSGTLANALLHHCGERIRRVGLRSRPGIVHRLDKGTSGVMVAAKTPEAMLSLGRQFRDRSTERRYLAVLRGVPHGGAVLANRSGVSVEPGGALRIEGNIGRSPRQPFKRALLAEGGRPAVTRARVIGEYREGRYSLVECRLETGRTHQIRVHLSALGYPLLGDPLYGASAKSLPEPPESPIRAAVSALNRQALHAGMLVFAHPSTGDRMRFESQPPRDMRDLLSVLERDD